MLQIQNRILNGFRKNINRLTGGIPTNHWEIGWYYMRQCLQIWSVIIVVDNGVKDTLLLLLVTLLFPCFFFAQTSHHIWNVIPKQYYSLSRKKWVWRHRTGLYCIKYNIIQFCLITYAFFLFRLLSTAIYWCCYAGA